MAVAERRVSSHMGARGRATATRPALGRRIHSAWVAAGDFPPSRGSLAKWAPQSSSARAACFPGVAGAGVEGKTNHSACCEQVLRVARWHFCFVLLLRKFTVEAGALGLPLEERRVRDLGASF